MRDGCMLGKGRVALERLKTTSPKVSRSLSGAARLPLQARGVDGGRGGHLARLSDRLKGHLAVLEHLGGADLYVRMTLKFQELPFLGT
jgi:hypothetical protein